MIRDYKILVNLPSSGYSIRDTFTRISLEIMIVSFSPMNIDTSLNYKSVIHYRNISFTLSQHINSKHFSSFHGSVYLVKYTYMYYRLYI